MLYGEIYNSIIQPGRKPEIYTSLILLYLEQGAGDDL